jgi:tetratricopeptide (TPR) repeat protein
LVEAIMSTIVDLDLRMATELYEAGRYAEAEQKFRDIIAANPDHAGAHNGLGLALAAQGRREEAIEHYRRAAELWEPVPQERKVALRYWADALYSLNRHDEAAGTYREAIAADANFAAAHTGLGLALAAQGRREEAIEHYRRAAELWQQEPQERKVALFCWADALSSLNRHDEAAGTYREAIAADAMFAAAHNGLGLALAAQKQFDDAIAAHRRAAELWEHEPQNRKLAVYHWADALRSASRDDEAAEKYRDAIADDANFAAAHNGLGLALAAQKQFDDAVAAHRRAAELWEKEPQNRKLALAYWADALYSLNRHGAAVAKYREAIGLDADFPAAYNGLGLALAAQGRFDLAIEQYGMAAERYQAAHSTDRKFPLRNWADALLSQQRYAEAAAIYRRAIEADASYASAHNGLGIALAAQERFADAIESYRRAAELWADKASNDVKFALCYWADALNARKLHRDAESKYRQAILADAGYAAAYNGLGIALELQERPDEAIAEYRRAAELWEQQASTDRKVALWNWGNALLAQERFEDAIARYDQAVQVAPDDSKGFFFYGNALAASGRYREALDRFDRAIAIKPDVPDNHHNKAHYLFQLGRYEDGWKSWRNAQFHYENALQGELATAEQLESAVYFADVLREVFAEHARSESYYRRVIARQDDHVGAWTGLAILYQQWADAEQAPGDLQARLSYAKRRAGELLHGKLDQGGKFRTLLSLADLHIEAQDWPEAKQALALAEAISGGSRLKRADVNARLGLVRLGSEEYSEAAKSFRDALSVTPQDLTLRNNLGKALLRSKEFDSAQNEFNRVLKIAPGHIDAQLAAAQVCIDMADDGEADYYKSAERHLTNALTHGRNKRSGSRQLRHSDIASIYYLRGYARVKRYESDAQAAKSGVLLEALSDFRKCRDLDRNHPKASAAIEKINQRLIKRIGESAVDRVGPFLIFLAGTAVFVLAQLDFFFQGTAVRASLGLPATKAITQAATYTALTFGALVFMIAGLYLPRLLKLKVAGIELQKASVDQLSAPSSLEISRFGSFKT